MARQSRQYQLCQATSITPCFDEFPGVYGFEMEVKISEKQRQCWQYSANFNKAYVKMKTCLPLLFKLSNDHPQNMYIRTVAAYTESDALHSPVLRCSSHMLELDGIFDERHIRLEHIVNAVHRQAIYEKDVISGRRSVRFPYSGPQPGAEWETVPYSMMCLNSCYTISRKPIALIFTLEHNQVIVGRRVLNMRVCAAPKRDFYIDETRGTTKGIKKLLPAKKEKEEEEEKDSIVMEREDIIDNNLEDNIANNEQDIIVNNLEDNIANNEQYITVNNLEDNIANNEQDIIVNNLEDNIANNEQYITVNNLEDNIANNEQDIIVNNLVDNIANNEQYITVNNLEDNIANNEQDIIVNNLEDNIANNEQDSTVNNLEDSIANNEQDIIDNNEDDVMFVEHNNEEDIIDKIVEEIIDIDDNTEGENKAEDNEGDIAMKMDPFAPNPGYIIPVSTWQEYFALTKDARDMVQSQYPDGHPEKEKEIMKYTKILKDHGME